MTLKTNTEMPTLKEMLEHVRSEETRNCAYQFPCEIIHRLEALCEQQHEALKGCIPYMMTDYISANGQARNRANHAIAVYEEEMGK